jgi:hypothetical protein
MAPIKLQERNMNNAKKKFKSACEEWTYYRALWVKKYHYEEAYTVICPRCIFYIPNNHDSARGDCLLMLKSGAGGMSRVSCQGFCHRFISTEGIDYNGNEIIPSIKE